MQMEIAMNIIRLTAAMILSGAVALANDCKNGVCMPPVGGERVYTVCVPVPQADIKNIPPTKPLDTFDGKTIALVGGSFMANITHSELKRLILAPIHQLKCICLMKLDRRDLIRVPALCGAKRMNSRKGCGSMASMS